MTQTYICNNKRVLFPLVVFLQLYITFIETRAALANMAFILLRVAKGAKSKSKQRVTQPPIWIYMDKTTWECALYVG